MAAVVLAPVEMVVVVAGGRQSVRPISISLQSQLSRRDACVSPSQAAAAAAAIGDGARLS